MGWFGMDAWKGAVTKPATPCSYWKGEDMKPTGIEHLSAEDAAIIHELYQELNIAVVKRLAKGQEIKFYIETVQGEKQLLRINDMKYYDWLVSDFRMYEYVAKSGINISRPVSMGSFRDKTLSYQLYTWLDGEDLIEALPRMSPAGQYSAGIKSGALMRKLHALPPENEAELWGIRFGRKVQDIIQTYNDKLEKFQDAGLLVRYLQDNQELFDKRPQTFTHGDWNTENLIFTPDGQIGIIDLSGENDYGDPWWEFWLIPHDLNSSAHFYSGQINGYFMGEPPTEFFRLLSYYNAYGTLKWSPENAKIIQNWFDDMQNPIPIWYLSDCTAV